MLRSSSRFLLAVAVVLPLACSRSPRQGGPDRQQPASRPEKEESGPELAPQLLRARLDAPQPPAYATADPLGKDTWPTVRRLYQADGYQPAWVGGGEARARGAGKPGARVPRRGGGGGPRRRGRAQSRRLRPGSGRHAAGRPFRRTAPPW